MTQILIYTCKDKQEKDIHMIFAILNSRISLKCQNTSQASLRECEPNEELVIEVH